MNDRGVTSVVSWVAFELVLIVLIYSLAQPPLQRVATDVTYERQYLATDIGLTLSALQSTSANILTVYDSFTLPKYSYSVQEGRFSNVIKNLLPVSAPFARNQELDLQMPATFEHPQRLYLTRTGNHIGVKDAPLNLLLRRCPLVKPEFSRIFLHEQNKEATAGFMHSSGSTVRQERLYSASPDEAYVSIINKEQPAITLVFNFKSANPEMSYALACYLGNGVLTANPEIPGVNIVPVDPETDHLYAPLAAGKTGVLILLPSAYQTKARAIGEALGEGARTWQKDK